MSSSDTLESGIIAHVSEKKYGYILSPSHRKLVFFHASYVVGRLWPSIKVGHRVTFSHVPAHEDTKERAVNVTVLDSVDYEPEREVGIVERVSRNGYAFIDNGGAQTIFAHYTYSSAAVFKAIYAGLRLSYVRATNDRGPCAIDVRIES